MHQFAFILLREVQNLKSKLFGVLFNGTGGKHDTISICDLLKQNQEQVAWGYFEI